LAENIQDIQRRIKSVNSTKQITHAMKLVASAKLKRTREQAESRRPYFEATLESIQSLAVEGEAVLQEFSFVREVKNTAYIVITGNRGLAGGYNSNICKLVDEHINSKDVPAKIIAVGSKGRDYFKSRNQEIFKEYLGISETPEFKYADEISHLMIDLFRENKVDEVYIAYTKFASMISQEPILLRLVPLDEELFRKPKKELATTEEGEPLEVIMQYEPDVQELLRYLVPQYLSGTIYGAMIESAASEQGARRVAMEAATDNATEMIDKLTLHYNRVRQAAITQELTEIVSGAEAL
jgi:F-type H+-transporting ATPase subunit gamma